MMRPDARLAFHAFGSGVPILFLHGVGSVRSSWDQQVQFFSSGHLAVALDMRGHGESRAPAATISIPAFAEDSAALIEFLGAGAAHICGLSMGGIVALQLWRARPDLVRSLILADTWDHHPEAKAGQSVRLAAIDQATMPELARARMPAVLGPAADPQLLERAIAVMAAKDPDVYRRSTEVLWVADMREVATTVTVPALVIVGELDRVTPPELSVELARLIAGARLEVIAGAGHLTNQEQPARFNQAVAAFVVQQRIPRS